MLRNELFLRYRHNLLFFRNMIMFVPCTNAVGFTIDGLTRCSSMWPTSARGRHLEAHVGPCLPWRHRQATCAA